jgi:DNA repair protein RecN (Recombination protein N)
MRREINPAGKSRAFINDTPVTVNLLKDLGEHLIDIHSQHQTLMLQGNSFQLKVIDSFAGNGKSADEYRKAFRSYRSLKKEYDEAREKAEKNQSDLEYYSFQLNQLEEAKLAEDEQEGLEKEQELLTHAEEIKVALGTASDLLSSETGSILFKLKEARQNLTKIKEFLPDDGEILKRTESSYIEINDLASEIEKLASAIDADPKRLAQVNERLDAIYSLMQKHRVTSVKDLIIKREEIKKIVRSIVGSDERLAELDSLLKKDIELLKRLSGEISGKRKEVVENVEMKITELLRQLGMPNARFRIDLSGLPDFTATGTDHADFLFSANKQVEPEDLAKIASGGELSRVMLSLKSLLTKNISLPTIIFDEIDSGVSGEVADKVGQILAGMGKYMQVINITHLPQVAARGTRHYHVYKDDTGDSTITRIRLLSARDRVVEVARLLSGSEITPIAMKNAQELIKSAQN